LDRRIHGARFRAARVNLLPGFATIDGLEDAALIVGAELMSERGDIDDVGIVRMNANCADLLRVLQAHVLPRFPGVGGFVHAVAGRALSGMSGSPIPTHTMLGFDSETASAPTEPVWIWPSVTGFQVSPPSVVLKTPPPVPPK
jgi:hypothetical protein